jgi:hypothetical protein
MLNWLNYRHLFDQNKSNLIALLQVCIPPHKILVRRRAWLPCGIGCPTTFFHISIKLPFTFTLFIVIWMQSFKSRKIIILIKEKTLKLSFKLCQRFEVWSAATYNTPLGFLCWDGTTFAIIITIVHTWLHAAVSIDIRGSFRAILLCLRYKRCNQQ